MIDCPQADEDFFMGGILKVLLVFEKRICSA